MIAERVKQISFSSTMQINQKANELKAAGIDIIDLSVQEPDFPTPQSIKKSAMRAIEDNFTRYTPAIGIPELIRAIRDKIKNDYNISYNQNEIIVSNGAKHSLYNTFMSLINQGDEVIVPLPIWVSYAEQIKLAQGIPLYVQTKEENNFLLSAGDLKKAISGKTKALIICNPCNPTGMVYPETKLRELAEICITNNIIMVVDEIYDKLIYDGKKFVSMAQLGNDVKEKTIIINGVSKTYAMTGWRIGYAAGPSEIIAAMGKIQSHTTSNPCSISQRAALEALNGDQSEVLKMHDEFERRRDLVYNLFKDIPAIKTIKPQGALNIFPNVACYLNTHDSSYNIQIRNSMELTKYILEKAHVAVVPGSVFGSDHHLRISFSNPIDTLTEAVQRIKLSLISLH
jgi:aspartate/methionine/tyrosine aminotransferase